MFASKNIKIEGPRPLGISIKRDDTGVPHIKANNFADCLWGAGYAHAIDRSTQLLMMRILGQGRLCELLSDNEESLAIDKFFRKSNWYSGHEAQLKKMDPESLHLCQRYCDGVNAGIASKKVSLLKVLGYTPEPWSIADSLLISKMAAYLTLAQSQTEIERFIVELLQADVSLEKIKELFPIQINQEELEALKTVDLEERIVPLDVLWNLALPRMMASNNWVISGDKTASGAAIMANDPHLEINRLPNVWCEQVLDWGQNYLMGMGMPGMPAVLVGRSKYVAWGATYTFMDTVDSWIEQCDEGMYLREGKWFDFDRRMETVKRKKHDSVDLVFYENNHGVLDGNPFEKGNYLATRWAGAESGAESLKSAFNMATASNAEMAMESLGNIESAWNWVISDIEGNIAYQMSGLMPLRKKTWNGLTPAPGWDASYDWQGFVELVDLPKSLNPESGYIVTANQDLNHLGKAKPINMPMGDYRAQRISDCLESKDNHDFETNMAIQMDVYSLQAELFLDLLLPLIENESSQVAVTLRQWDRSYDTQSVGAPIFEAFYANLRSIVFGDQEDSFGAEVQRHLSSETGLFIDFYQNFDKVLLNADSLWFDELSQQEAFIKSYRKVCEEYDAKDLKTWGEINTVTFTNILLQGKLPQFLGFDSKPTALIGGRATPHQGQVYRAGGRDTSFAPSVRIIADMSKKGLKTCIAGGPSDNRFTPWYTSDLDNWLTGTYKQLDV